MRTAEPLEFGFFRSWNSLHCYHRLLIRSSMGQQVTYKTTLKYITNTPTNFQKPTSPFLSFSHLEFEHNDTQIRSHTISNDIEPTHPGNVNCNLHKQRLTRVELLRRVNQREELDLVDFPSKFIVILNFVLKISVAYWVCCSSIWVVFNEIIKFFVLLSGNYFHVVIKLLKHFCQINLLG